MSIALPTFDTVTRPARTRLAETLRDRVAGDETTDRDARAAAIWLAEGERWFSSDDPIWRVHEDAAMFVGGIRALLLQTLHPAAMRAVSEHSGFRGDMWGRLNRTSRYLAVTTFGTADDAQQAVDVVRSIHARVTGTMPDGTPYVASDPHLLAWVHAAEVESFLASHQRHGALPLNARDADLYVAQSARSATALGVRNAPHTVAELEVQLAAYRRELVASPEAHETARFLLLQPPVSGVSRVGYGVLAAGAVALLPVWAKAMLRLPALPITERLVTHHVAGLGVDTIRWALTGPGNPRVAAS